MLHRSFKPAKCKTALQLAVSRLKLLKNKKGVQVKHLRRELAQLLDSGQVSTARIRVEHVVREEKMLAAFELIEIYCDLIVARMPIIESQKNCPIDLKEAVASVVFASPRCADVPELMDMRKHFAAKYGKDFVSAAVELRPECGVSRLLVEKLSAKAPDGPTKVKILSAIAEEHNVQWDSKSLMENDIKPPEDLLNGPNSFEEASKIHVELAKVLDPTNSVETGPPSSQVPSKHSEKYDVHGDFYAPNSRSSSYSQNVPHTDIDSNKAMPSDASHPSLQPPRSEDVAGIELRHPYVGDVSDSSLGREGWKMKFEDATAAAQAAAESAERASIAARAAAELASQGRMSSQHSAGTQNAPTGGPTHEGFESYSGLKFQGENLAKAPVSNTINDRDDVMQHDTSGGNEQDDFAGLAERFYNLKNNNKASQPPLAGHKTSRSPSSNSSVASMDDNLPVNDFQMTDRHSRKSSYESEKDNLFGEANVQRVSSESVVDSLSEGKDEIKSESISYFEDASMRRQSSNISSHSHFRTPSDDNHVTSSFNWQKSGEEAAEDPFNVDEGKTGRKIKETNSFGNATAVFDDSGSDDEGLKVDLDGGHNTQESSAYVSSEGRKSSYPFENTNSWISRQSAEGSTEKYSSQHLSSLEQSSSGLFSEGFTRETQPHEFMPVTFDDSPGPSSESEKELDESRPAGNTSAGIFLHKEKSFTGSSEQSNRRTWLQPSSPDSVVVEGHSERKVEDSAQSGLAAGYNNFLSSQPSTKVVKSGSISDDSDENMQASQFSSLKNDVQSQPLPDTLKDTKPVEESSSDSGNELNFGILTGGLRNKGYKRPPYPRNPSDKYSSSKPGATDKSIRTEQFSSSPGVDQSSVAHDLEPSTQMGHSKLNEKSSFRTPVTYFDSGDGLSDEPSQQAFSRIPDPHYGKADSEVNKKSSSRTFFDSDNSDVDEDLPKRTISNKTRPGTGFSRRTKVSPPKSQSSFSKARVPSESSETVDYVGERTAPSRSSYAADRLKPQSQVKSSDYGGSLEQQKSVEVAASKPIPQFRRPLYEERSSRVSSAPDTRKDLTSESKSLGYSESYKQPRSSEQAASKPIPEFKRSSREESLKFSAKEQTSNPPKAVASGTAERTKTSSTHSEAPSGENSMNKASHVHPKLPDYDAFAAHLRSLRQNRQ